MHQEGIRQGINASFVFLRDTAGQERFHTITTSYYRGAMVCFIQQFILNFNYIGIC